MSETVGQQLRQARQEHNLTLEQASQGTHIRLHYLEAMEAGEFDRLPSKAQARGFLRAYAGYLGLNPDTLVVLLDGLEAPSPLALFQGVESLVPKSVVSSEQVKAIFLDIGERLKRRRELLGLSLDEVERNTRLRQHYLKSLEAGDLDELPSTVQCRGMLHNYATFLGLDSDQLLLRYAEGLQARLAEKQAARPHPQAPKPSRKPIQAPRRRLFSSDILLSGIFILSLAAFVIWGVIRISAMRTNRVPTVTVPSIAEALMPTPAEPLTETPTSAPTPTEGGLIVGPLPTIALVVTEQAGTEVSPETTLPTDSGAPVQIYISVLQRAWMRVTVDGEIEFQGRVVPGSAYTFAGDTQIELLTGNGAGLQVFFNQTDLGVLGIYGEVVYRLFTPEGIIVPTPTVTPTPTATQPVTATPVVTDILQPTPAP